MKSSGRWRGTRLCQIALSVALLAYNSAAAQPGSTSLAPDDYDTLVAKGVAAYQAESYAAAYDFFRLAHLLNPNARTLRGLGIVEHKLGHFASASQLLQRALGEQRVALNATQRADALQLIREMAPHIGRCTIQRIPADATVRIDGRELEIESDAPIELDLGVHKVSVSAPGYVPRARQLAVAGGEQSTLAFELKPLPKLGPAHIPDDDRADPSALVRTGAVVAAVAAGLALAAGVVAWPIREAAARRWNSADCLVDGQSRRANCKGQHDAAFRAGTVMAVGFVGAIVLGATSALLFANSGHAADSGEHAAACGAGPGQLGVTCAARF